MRCARCGHVVFEDSGGWFSRHAVNDGETGELLSMETRECEDHCPHGPIVPAR